MLIMLLMMLCIENAFAHRLDITVHKSGLSVILEAFLEWLYGFNNFRVAFLFMVLHDAPLTLSNFFLLSACRCAGPNVLSWPLLSSSFALCVSLCWRLVILGFAYSRLLARSLRRGESARRRASALPLPPSRNASFRNASTAAVADPTIASGDSGAARMDEGWPWRWAKLAVYGRRGRRATAACPGAARADTLYLQEEAAWDKRSPAQCCGFWLSWMVLKGVDLLCAVFRRVACVCLACLGITACTLLCWLPCLHHYTCRRNSFAHRHQCARSCVRNCTLAFHYAMFAFSAGFSLLMIMLNLILITSVQLIGPNHLPPEISRLCISVDSRHRVVRPLFHPEPSLFSSHTFPDDDQGRSAQCKPIWARIQPAAGVTILDQWAPGWGRQSPGPWQARFPLGRSTVLAVSTHFISDHSVPKWPRHTLLYDMALLRFGPDNSTRTTQCAHRRFSGWFFANKRNSLGFPYFWACTPTIRIRKGRLIDCRDLLANKKRP